MFELMLAVVVLGGNGFTVTEGDAKAVTAAPVSSGGFVVTDGKLPQSLVSTPAPRQTVTFLWAPWCGYCVEPHKYIDALTPEQRAALPFDIQTQDADKQSAYKGQLPAFTWTDGKTKWHSTGWSSMETFVGVWQGTIKNPRGSVSYRLTPAELREFASTYNGPRSGVAGRDFYTHLQDSSHGFTVDQLQGLTRHECKQIHGGHHNGYLSTTTIFRR